MIHPLSKDYTDIHFFESEIIARHEVNETFFLCLSLTDDAAAAGPDELVVDRSYVKKKLEHGLTRIWQVCKEAFAALTFSRAAFCSSQSRSVISPHPTNHPAPLISLLQDVQLKVKAYILGTDMSNFKYDDFIVVLDVISRYASAPARPTHLFPLIGITVPSSSLFFFLFFPSG